MKFQKMTWIQMMLVGMGAGLLLARPACAQQEMDPEFFDVYANTTVMDQASHRTPGAQAVFALVYAHKKVGIIPDAVLNLGRADDSSVVRAVLIQNEKAFAIYAASQDIDWAGSARERQPIEKVQPDVT